VTRAGRGQDNPLAWLRGLGPVADLAVGLVVAAGDGPAAPLSEDARAPIEAFCLASGLEFIDLDDDAAADAEADEANSDQPGEESEEPGVSLCVCTCA
jgi:hypothetical protein